MIIYKSSYTEKEFENAEIDEMLDLLEEEVGLLTTEHNNKMEVSSNAREFIKTELLCGKDYFLNKLGKEAKSFKMTVVQ